MMIIQITPHTVAIPRRWAYFGRGSGSILLDNVGCTGLETRLIDCPANPVRSHNCAHYEDAGVQCRIGGKLPVCSTWYYFPSLVEQYTAAPNMKEPVSVNEKVLKTAAKIRIIYSLSDGRMDIIKMFYCSILAE